MYIVKLSADFLAPKFTYGLEELDTLSDILGAVDCQEGRVVASPNILLRRMQVPSRTYDTVQLCPHVFGH